DRLAAQKSGKGRDGTGPSRIKTGEDPASGRGGFGSLIFPIIYLRRRIAQAGADPSSALARITRTTAVLGTPKPRTHMMRPAQPLGVSAVGVTIAFRKKLLIILALFLAAVGLAVYVQSLDGGHRFGGDFICF